MNTIIENLTRDYFAAFSRKDTGELKRMFDENVQLIDWDVNYTGRSLVLEFNQKLFDNVGTIKVTPELIAVYGTTSMSKILVEVGDVALKVVDIITFDSAGKILKIEAYKQ
jgi:ketosteroid isomerase-like protein